MTLSHLLGSLITVPQGYIPYVNGFEDSRSPLRVQASDSVFLMSPEPHELVIDKCAECREGILCRARLLVRLSINVARFLDTFPHASIGKSRPPISVTAESWAIRYKLENVLKNTLEAWLNKQRFFSLLADKPIASGIPADIKGKSNHPHPANDRKTLIDHIIAACGVIANLSAGVHMPKIEVLAPTDEVLSTLIAGSQCLSDPELTRIVNYWLKARTGKVKLENAIDVQKLDQESSQIQLVFQIPQTQMKSPDFRPEGESWNEIGNDSFVI
jgi:hypothetical protein